CNPWSGPGIVVADRASGARDVVRELRRLFGNPDAVRPDRVVHGVRREVDLARPSHSAVFDCNAREYFRIIQRCENTGIVTSHESRKVDFAACSIDKAHVEAKAGKRRDIDDEPLGLRAYGSGGIRFGLWFLAHSSQSSSNASRCS